MIACVCGFEASTEGDLMSHMRDCHRLSYGLEPCYHAGNREGGRSTLQNEDPASLALLADRQG
jgi:hypothetical protein